MFNRSYTYKDVLTRASMTIQLIDDTVLYKAQLFSTNGNILSSSEKETTVSVTVFKGLEDITQRFTDIVWSRFSVDNGNYQEDLKWGEQHKGKTSINITRDDIIEKANIQIAIYDMVDGKRSLVASDFISFIDINDIKGSNTPPESPKNGDLWLNTNSFPPKLMVWNSQLGEWVEMTVSGEERRNLLRNSNFYGSDFKYWNNVGSPIISIEKMDGKKWARIRSSATANNYCGISQIIEAKSSTKYAFQMLSKVYAHSTNPNSNAVVTFYSIDKNNNKTLIQEKEFDITFDVTTYTTTFTSLTNTKKIEVIVSGQKNVIFDFVTTNLKLEANSIPTAWEIAIEDMEDALNAKVNNTPEEVFESLTDGGKMQGIYVDTDEDGNKNYYFNASYIKSGYILGKYIDAKNLTVSRNDGKETLKIDSNGNVTIKGNIQIQGIDGGFKDAASVDDITYTVVLTNENHSVMCDVNGTPISGQIGSAGKAKTKVLAYKGNKLLQAVDTTSQLTEGKFCVSIKSTDGTGTLKRVSGSFDEYYIDGTISDNGYFELEITFEKISNAKAVKRFTYTKVKPGATGPQGPQGTQGLPGAPGTNGKTTYFHIKYSSVSNPTSSSQMTDTPNTYIGTYVDYTETSSTDPKKYTWARFQGAQGSKGDQGIPGTNGIDGKTSYLHIKYSNDGGKTFTGNNGEDVGTWIGQYTDFTLNDSTSVTSYKWSKIQGPQGPAGTAGAQGPQGPQGEALETYDGTFSEGVKFWSTSYSNYAKPNTNTQIKTANTSMCGGKTLKITNDVWLYSKNPIPIEDGRIYKFIFRVRQLQNPTNDSTKNKVYAGATEFAHDGSRLSTNNGTYFVVSNASLPIKWNSMNGDSAPVNYNSAKDDQYIWTEYTKYMSTTSKAAISYANVVKFPAVNAFTSRTKYIKPMFIVNYSGGNGIVEVDSLIVKDVTSEYEAAKESANKLNNNAQEIWDKVTQEGKTQGLFIAQNGKVYINGEYINAKNLRVQDTNNNLTFGVDSSGNVTIKPTTFTLTPSAANQTTFVNALNNNTSSTSTSNGIYLSGGKIYINASNIVVGTLDASKATIKNLNASNITTGTLSGARLAANAIDGKTITGATIQNATTNPTFKVTPAGALTCSNATITGGSFNIANKFKVDTAGNIISTGTASLANGNFSIDSSGNITANKMTLNSGCTFKGAINVADKFKVDIAGNVTTTGSVTASNLKVTGGSINIGSSFSVNASGTLTAKNANIVGTITGSNINGSSFTSLKTENGTNYKINIDGATFTSSTITDLESQSFIDRVEIKGSQIDIYSGYTVGNYKGDNLRLHADDIHLIDGHGQTIFRARANGESPSFTSDIGFTFGNRSYIKGDTGGTTWSDAQLELNSGGTGSVALSLHRPGYSHAAIVHDGTNSLKVNLNNGTHNIWHSGNLNPSSLSVNYANTSNWANGARYSEEWHSTNYGSSYLATGNGDQATWSTHNVILKTHWGLGVRDYTNTCNFLIDARTGNTFAKGYMMATKFNTSSDRRLKENITPINEKFEKFFMDLKPVNYNMINSDDGRLHNGFIAQEIEESMNKHAISYEEFAGLEKTRHISKDEIDVPVQILEDGSDKDKIEYSLSYGEFTALNTHMIQKAFKIIEKQQAKIEELENIIKKMQ